MRHTNVDLTELQIIPGVGPSIARDLWDLGIRHVSDLKGKNPEQRYAELEALRGAHIDRCMLYVMRLRPAHRGCAEYYASRKTHDPEKLQWWHAKRADYPA